MYSSDKCLMNLEESHFQNAKMPNRAYVEARYLWVEGLITLEESHFQAAKMSNMLPPVAT